MAIQVKHNFVSPVADAGNPNEVGPNEWNDAHSITMASGFVIGRASAGVGPAEEVSITSMGAIAGFSTVTQAAGAAIPADTKTIKTINYVSPGDGGGAIYFRVSSQPSHQGKIRSSDRFLPNGSIDATNGGWWELQADTADVRCFGAKVNGTILDNALTAFTNAKAYAIAKGVPIYVPAGIFYSSAPLETNEAQLVIDPKCRINSTVTGLPFDAFWKQGQYIEPDVFSSFRFPSSYVARYGESIWATAYDDLGSSGAGPVMHRVDTFYDGTATNAYLAGAFNHYSFMQYGERKKNAGSWASGSVALYGGHVNVFSVGQKTGGTGLSELTPVAIGINFMNDAVLSPGFNIYNDFVVSGPRNTDAYFLESFMAGASFLVQKHNPGTQRDATHLGSYGLSVVTRPQSGGFSAQAATGSNYALHAGLAIAGFAGPQNVFDGDAASATPGFTYGVLVGGGPSTEGGGSVWLSHNARSKLVVGAYISDYTTAGVKIDRKSPGSTPYSIHVTSASGIARFEDLLQFTNLPTSATGLAFGTVWRDAAAGNVLKVA